MIAPISFLTSTPSHGRQIIHVSAPRQFGLCTLNTLFLHLELALLDLIVGELLEVVGETKE